MKKQKSKKSSNKKIYILTAIAILLIISFSIYYLMASKNPQVEIETSVGNIVLELYTDKAPITVNNFLRYVDEEFYDHTIFHRVIKDFMIQGGGMLSNGTEKQTHAPIKLESNNGLSNDEGTIAMARTSSPNSATSQFFINTADNDFLNYGYRDEGYAVFGKVIKGMDVVAKINSVKTTKKFGSTDWPTSDVVIKKISRIN